MIKIVIVPSELLPWKLSGTILGRSVFDVKCFPNAEQALPVIKNWQPQLIIFSDSLPDTKPTDFIALLKKETPTHILMQ